LIPEIHDPDDAIVDAHGGDLGKLTVREQVTQTGRIVVLHGTQTWGDGKTIRRQTLELAGQIAEELYRVCPWAAPTEP